MNDVLRRILDTGSVTTDEGQELPVHSQIPPAQGEFLADVIRAERPTQSLEIGLAYGISSLYLCEALAEVGALRHWVVDPLQFGQASPEGGMRFDDDRWSDLEWNPDFGWRGIGLANLHRAGFADLVEHLNAPSHLALPRLIEDGLSIQFAFIDGWHTFDYVLVDFFLIDHLLDVGGVIAFDDANNPAIQQVLRFILANRRYEVISDQRVGGATGDGLRARLVGGLHRLVDRLGPRPRPVMVNSADLGLPEVRCVVLRKIADDVLGDGSNGSRRWNDHTQF